MKEMILKHITIIKNMKQSHIPYEFLGEFGEETCALVSGQVSAYGLSGFMELLRNPAKQYLMHDPKVLLQLKQFVGDLTDLQKSRTNELLCQATEKKLSEFDASDLQEIVTDEVIPVQVQYLYLLYFKEIHLSQEERKQIFLALEKCRIRLKDQLARRTRKERQILLHPVFLSNMLDDLWETDATWTQLLHPHVLAAVERINKEASSSLRLAQAEFQQIVERPEQILQLLEQVLSYFLQEQRAEFLNLWIQNGSLLADLKRLSWLLPAMEEEQKTELLGIRVSYVCALYKANLTNLNLTELNNHQQNILLYAIVSKKKHFLNLVNAHSEAFRNLPYHSFLLDPEIYERFFNLNTLTEKNLQEACLNYEDTNCKYKKFLKRATYTFDELKLLSKLDSVYVQLYELLANERSDDRLRIIKELVNCKGLNRNMTETELNMFAERLSEKPLSVWKHTSFAHIKDLKESICVQLLKEWDRYAKYIPELQNESQVCYLIRNREILERYDTFAAFQKNMLVEDTAWKYLKENLSFDDAFVKRYEESIRRFVSDGKAEIIYQFCQGAENKHEEIRRLLSAELMGKFQDLKYHANDLEKEIAYPITADTENVWKENLQRTIGEKQIWEEDGLIPVLQIGEIPKHTCISYQNGLYKNCLLSCFDSNKKVLFAKVNGMIVFRALVRLTKGSSSSKPAETTKIEFADLTRTDSRTEKDMKEKLILFLERPYFSKISSKQEDAIVSMAFQLVEEKAKKLQTKVVISQSYHKYEASKNYESRDYYVYISASKNGSQYLDSLRGEATVSDSGMYGKNSFLLKPNNQEEGEHKTI